jgi:hypothetical protein
MNWRLAIKRASDHMSLVGPETTSRDVGYLVTMEGKADIPLTSPKDRV